MKKSLLELDPDADALLILQSPNLQQVHAVKEVDLRDMTDKAEPKTAASTPAKEKKKSKTLTDLKKMKSLQPYREDGSPNELEFRVSTKHLCIASPVFRKMIQGNFQESQPNENGLLTIRTSDWNAQALLVLLDIIHGHHRQVPRDPDLDTIAQIGFLVDYYDCLEVVEIFFDRWQAHISDWWIYDWIRFDKSSVDPFGESQLLMLFIAFTFRSRVVFKNLTISAIFTTSGHIETHLPIPSQILDKIDQQRIGLLDQMFTQLYNLQEDLFVGRVGCSLECSCRLLGYLMKQMRDQALPMTKPEQPFLGFSVTMVAGFIRGIKTPSWYSKKQNVDPCKLEKSLSFGEKEPEKSTEGIDLDDL
ncbi:hypothetical protein FNAPI_8514 [Fusarium napiforme]|uniref:BTB domain-containing protein n=1 Tax=Fusarium napiforme TaxID=42672 RepID=A0A8H5J257_9HYPO|nr:hypothetical protein FNAPI_8514 [Fusarium napiforme]